MPHIFIDYTDNLDDDLDVDALTHAIHDAAVDCGVFPKAGVRTRVTRQTKYLVADKNPDNSFVHVIARIGFGRSDEEKRKAGDLFFKAMSGILDPIYAKRPFAYAFEFVEINTWKKNNMH